MAVDLAGNVYVADTGNNMVRKVTPEGMVTTLAGLEGGSVAVDSAGNLYLTSGNSIQKATPVGSDWVVTTLAGLANSSGSVDGTGDAARFNGPSGLAVDSAGNAYVADHGNFTIRKVTPAGVVTTLAGLAGKGGRVDGTGSDARFGICSWDWCDGPIGVAVDSVGNVYVADSNGTIRRAASLPTVFTAPICRSRRLAEAKSGNQNQIP